jgi:hypothetical protein
MKLTTLNYSKTSGWSTKSFPDIDSEKTLIIIFGSSSYFDDAEPIAELKAFYKKSKFSGCSTAGEIFEGTISDDSLTVAIMQFDKSDVHVVTAEIDDPVNSQSTGIKLASELNKENLKHVIVFSEGLNVNGSELAKGFDSVLTSQIKVSGGLAGDGSAFKQTWVMAQDKPVRNTISAIGFYGDSLDIGCGSKGGWDTFGPERIITKSKGNIVMEIDGEPALDLYKRYLGDRANELPSSALLFPLSIRKNFGSEEKLVRTILSVDHINKTMTFAGDVPEGWCVQLMRANMDRLIEGASGAAQSAKSKSQVVNGDTLAIAVSCVGRRLVLGERTEEEVEATLQSYLAGTKQIGFYSYGELTSDGFQPCSLHNQTMTITSISEK